MNAVITSQYRATFKRTTDGKIVYNFFTGSNETTAKMKLDFQMSARKNELSLIKWELFSTQKTWVDADGMHTETITA